MEALIVGFLTAITVSVGALFWQLLVRPEVLLTLLGDRGAIEAGWFKQHSGTLTALRWTTGVMVLLLGFFTGLTLTFLSSTGS
jgi:hypothetical protein